MTRKRKPKNNKKSVPSQTHALALKKHDSLCDIVASTVFKTLGGFVDTKYEYDRGELDVLQCLDNGVRIYYEIKSRLTSGGLVKAHKQVNRAIKYNECDMGYIVTPSYVTPIKVSEEYESVLKDAIRKELKKYNE